MFLNFQLTYYEIKKVIKAILNKHFMLMYVV